MGNDVFANGREISCKSGDGKSICAFPDVCFTPPQTPATPPGVPIPYPNTGMSSDTTSGTKKVKITGKEVMLKNKSYFKSSTGDEAGCAPKKGVVTSKIKGKVYFTSWSMNVKFEGENVVRHLDLTTHNHASINPNTPPTAHIDNMAADQVPDCEELKSKRSALKAKLPNTRKNKATLAVAATVFRGKAKVKAAASSVRVGRKYNGKYSKFAKGIKKGGTSNVQTCDKPPQRFNYAKGQARPKQGHAEAKLIEDFFRGGGKGKLVISVSKKPCPDCQRLIDEVNKGKDGKGRCNKITVCTNESWES
jgi:hypothetical protein